MPRKAKEKIDETKKNDEIKNVVKKSADTKNADTSKKTVAEKKTSSASSVSSASSKKVSKKESPATKTSTRKSALAKIIESVSNEFDDEEAVSKEKTKKSTKKQPSKRTAKKTTRRTTKNNEQPIQILEYYDLPYKYGNTVVRLLAQTPKTLFVYWEVSDSDIENFKKSYGDDFFNKTKPILIVHNLTLNKTSEIEINDFASCWYLNTDDSDCKFDVELARKFIKPNSSSNEDSSDYLYIEKSNDLQSPNNHILFEKIQEFVVFRNVSNDNIIKKNIKSFKFLKDIYKFYKDMYDEEILNNPSSQFK